MSSKRLLKELKIGIADIAISFISDGFNLGFEADSAYRRFAIDSEPEIVFDVHCGNIPSKELGEDIFDSNSTWSLHFNNGKHILRFGSLALDPLPYKLAILRPDLKFGDIYIKAWKSYQRQPVNPLGYPFDEVLMVSLLSLGRGVLIHACGISDNGRGILFAGISGAGKSTLANLWKSRVNSAVRDTVILSDDRIIIRKIDGRFWMYGTPWHGDAKVCSPEKVPLEKIFFLKHAKKNTTKSVASMEATSRLIVRSFPTFWDKRGMEFTLKFCAELAQSIPSYELGFLPDDSVLDFVKDECVRL